MARKAKTPVKVEKKYVGRADKGKKRRLVTYKVPTKQLIAIAAKSPDKIKEIAREREVARMAKLGVSYEEMGSKLGIETKEAYELTKRVLDKWTKELALDAVQARELDLKRYDALLLILWADAEPRPMINPANGLPVLDADTGQPVMLPGDKMAIKLIIDILDKRAKLLGLESAQKMELGGKLELIRREFVGVDPDKL